MTETGGNAFELARESLGRVGWRAMGCSSPKTKPRNRRQCVGKEAMGESLRQRWVECGLVSNRSTVELQR